MAEIAHSVFGQSRGCSSVEVGPCRICANSEGNRRFFAHEMMFGTGERFAYTECAACGCLQIEEIPADLSRYYTRSYYSFSLATPGILKSLMQTSRCRYATEGKGLLGRLLLRVFHDPTVASLAWAEVTRSSRILDVGCGTGRVLHQLRNAGFERVLGIDPYLDHELVYRNGLRILKRSIHEMDGQWDLVMFHHSFEHVSDPVESLRAAHRLLAENGCCLLRMPVASSYAWRHYRENWIQLDPPRHVFIPTTKSVESLAAQTKFELQTVVFDSDEFQFWGSEQSLRNIAKESNCSFGSSPPRSIFQRSQIRSFRRHSALLNATGEGDQAAFYLRTLN